MYVENLVALCTKKVNAVSKLPLYCGCNKCILLFYYNKRNSFKKIKTFGLVFIHLFKIISSSLPDCEGCSSSNMQTLKNNLLTCKFRIQVRPTRNWIVEVS